MGALGFGRRESITSAGMFTRATLAGLGATTDFSGFSPRKEVPLSSENKLSLIKVKYCAFNTQIPSAPTEAAEKLRREAAPQMPYTSLQIKSNTAALIGSAPTFSRVFHYV